MTNTLQYVTTNYYCMQDNYVQHLEFISYAPLLYVIITTGYAHLMNTYM